MNRQEFVRTYLDSREIVNMLDKSDRNIYAHLDIFAKMYTDEHHYTLDFKVKDYDEKETDPDTLNFIKEIENKFYLSKLDEIYHECIDMYGDSLTINKFSVRYFEKRNKFIDQIVESICERANETDHEGDEI